MKFATIRGMFSRNPSSLLLSITGVVLTEWLLITAELTLEFQYYVWAYLVVIAWSEAEHTRNPYLYPQRPFRIFFYSMIFVGLLMFNKSIIFIQQFGLPAPQSALDLAVWWQWLAG